LKKNKAILRISKKKGNEMEIAWGHLTASSYNSYAFPTIKKHSLKNLTALKLPTNFHQAN
jgi:hypothetical protein